MKKQGLLIGFLVLTVACNMTTPIPASESAPMATLPSTPVPAPTTPTDSPLPTPHPRYFSDEFESQSPFWQFFQTGGIDSPLSMIENGVLRIDIPSRDTWFLGIHNAHTYSNVVVQAKISAGSAGSMGLVCRYTESDGWFEFNIASDGSYSVLLGRWLAPGIAKYIPIAADGSKLLAAGNINHEIGLSCEENTLNLYVGETLLRRLDVTNYGLTRGNIGVTAASFEEAPMTALFEWVRVSGE